MVLRKERRPPNKVLKGANKTIRTIKKKPLRQKEQIPDEQKNRELLPDNSFSTSFGPFDPCLDAASSENSCNDALARLTRHLLASGILAETVLVLCQAWNKSHNNPRLSSGEVFSMVTGIAITKHSIKEKAWEMTEDGKIITRVGETEYLQKLTENDLAEYAKDPVQHEEDFSQSLDNYADNKREHRGLILAWINIILRDCHLRALAKELINFLQQEKNAEDTSCPPTSRPSDYDDEIPL